MGVNVFHDYCFLILLYFNNRINNTCGMMKMSPGVCICSNTGMSTNRYRYMH